MGLGAITETDNNSSKTRRVGGSCRASQVELSGKQRDGRAGAADAKLGAGGASFGWYYPSTANELVGPGGQGKKLSRALRDDKEWGGGWRTGGEGSRRL